MKKADAVSRELGDLYDFARAIRQFRIVPEPAPGEQATCPLTLGEGEERVPPSDRPRKSADEARGLGIT